MATETAISLAGVEKSFGRKAIYRGLDLEVRRGEVMVIVGPSGTGKSVLLKLIDGLLEPDAGRIRVDGADIVGKSEDELRAVRRRIGFVFQGAALFDSMTVAENVAYGLDVVRGKDGAKVRDRVQECLEWVGLPKAGPLMPAELSGGMRKRVGLARAIAPGPQIILYDEPTTGLDPSNTRRIDELILAMQERLAATSIVITHDMASALNVADRIGLVAEQRIALVTTADEARRAPPPALAGFMQGSEQTESQ